MFFTHGRLSFWIYFKKCIVIGPVPYIATSNTITPMMPKIKNFQSLVPSFLLLPNNTTTRTTTVPSGKPTTDNRLNALINPKIFSNILDLLQHIIPELHFNFITVYNKNQKFTFYKNILFFF